MPIVVIGAGLAGLRIASEFHRQGEEVICLEAAGVAGGRIRSIYGEDGALEYEAGPWRVPGDHRRVRNLFRGEGVRLVPLSTPPLSPSKTRGGPAVVPGVTCWDVHAFTSDDPRRADEADLATGYADQTHSASGSAPYSTAANEFFVAPAGFTTLVEKLAEGVDVRYNHRVIDVKREHHEYTITAHCRIGHNAFETIYFRARTLFVCVPPGMCRGWTIFDQHARSVLSAVDEGELHHIYAKQRVPQRCHLRDASSLLAQSVSTQYGNEWFQASYSGGRIARFWQHVLLTSPRTFRVLLFRSLQRLWRGAVDFDRGADVRSHFWPVAFHRWRAVPRFCLERAVRLAVRPSPWYLPGVYLAGEAFSSFQAWMEGALETAELALAAHRHDVTSGVCTPRFPPEHRSVVMVEGWPLDVTAWSTVHPGGALALRNHLREDVTPLMRHVQHSARAWAVVHSLKDEACARGAVDFAFSGAFQGSS